MPSCRSRLVTLHGARRHRQDPRRPGSRAPVRRRAAGRGLVRRPVGAVGAAAARDRHRQRREPAARRHGEGRERRAAARTRATRHAAGARQLRAPDARGRPARAGDAGRRPESARAGDVAGTAAHPRRARVRPRAAGRSRRPASPSTSRRATARCGCSNTRARSVDRRFALSAANLPVAVDLVPPPRRQSAGDRDGGGARCRCSACETLASRLEERLLLLRSAARSALSRHQTLRATLEWSHALLDPREQAVLRRLAVFVGSFRVDTAQRAIADAEMDEWAVLDALSALVDKSLVQTERLEPPRYRLLETMRLFCAEQLVRCGDGALAEQRHGACRWPSSPRRSSATSGRCPMRPGWPATRAEYDDLQIAFDRALRPPRRRRRRRHRASR